MKLFCAHEPIAEVLEYKIDPHAPITNPKSQWCLVKSIRGEQFWCPIHVLTVRKEA